MVQANCCAGKGKEGQVDMERTRQKEISRQKERERRMSEKKKRESAKQGVRIREGKCQDVKSICLFDLQYFLFSRESRIWSKLCINK